MTAEDLAEVVAEAITGALKAQADVHAAEIAALRTEFDEKIKSIPTPRDGRDGVDGKDGRDGVDGQHGTDGAKGMDAEPGKDGRDGRDGKDGIASLDQITAIASKTVDDRLASEVQKQVAEVFAAQPILKYRDVYQAGTEYRPGEAVSWGGQVYIATEPTSAKPGDSKAWSLAVKRGRDGRDAK